MKSHNVIERDATQNSNDLMTVLCPVYNEEASIESVLQFFVGALPSEKELFVIDGGSTDQTVAIVQEWSSHYPNIRLLHNPHKTVPYALNIGIQASKGDPIVRLDAHTEYAQDYFEAVLLTFHSTNADIVGGPMRPIGKTIIQKSIAMGTSNIFGIGDSHFHNDRYEGWVDSVYLGAWKRAIFDEIGYFDESLVRNQDDEFHYRANQNGKKIYLNPSIQSFYSPRSSLEKLFSQYYQYGFYKPLVIKKVNRSIRLRHLIPAAFVGYLFSLPLAFAWEWWGLPLVAYLILNIYFSLSAKNIWPVRLTTLAVYPTLHIAYGWGFLHGLWHWNTQQQRV